MADQQKIGFIGIGNMGRPMSANLIKAGFAVLGYDLDAAKLKAWADETGGEAAESLADMAAAVDVVITMLPRGADVRKAVMEAEGGAIANGLEGGIVVDMSSSEPLGTQELGADLKAKGVTLVDAPVSGGTSGATDATLAIMIGGEDEAAIEKVQPLLEAMGQNLFRTGPLGSGHAIKSLNNFVAAANYATAAEAMLIGQKFGVDAATVIDIINVSSGRNSATQGLIPGMVLTRKFAAGFALGLIAKDVGIAQGLAHGVGVKAPFADLISERWSAARDALGEDEDFSAAIKHWEAENGMELKTAG